MRDLARARLSEKRGVERDYGATFELFRKSASLPRELEVMRLESRLGTRAKIKSVLESIGVDVRPCFQQLFDTHIAKDIIGHFWTQIRVQRPLVNNRLNPETATATASAVRASRTISTAS